MLLMCKSAEAISLKIYIVITIINLLMKILLRKVVPQLLIVTTSIHHVLELVILNKNIGST